MPKGVYKRKKVGRPKGSKNKLKELMQSKSPWDENNLKIGSTVRIKLPNEPTEPSSFHSRLEAATVKYEQAIDYLVTTLKGK